MLTATKLRGLERVWLMGNRITIIVMLALLCRPSMVRAADEMETRTGRIAVSYPFPPDSELTKLVTPIAKRYSLPVTVKSFDELRSIELDDRGEIKSRSRELSGTTRPAKDEAQYSVYVPKTYKPNDKPFGLIVWISPGEGVGMQPSWPKVLDKHEMIYIAPHDVPNQS